MRFSTAPNVETNNLAQEIPTLRMNKDTAIDLFRTADCVCFDVDSTVIQEEGIDKLAEFMGASKLVAEWTKKAMEGNVLFQDALAARLNLIRPSQGDLTEFLKENPPKYTPNIQELIFKLRERNVEVFLVSGGFRQLLDPIAESLSIGRHHVYANNLLFHPVTGSYSGFDEKEMTSRDGGKASVLSFLKDAYSFKRIVMVGDGVTDLQARPPADLMIGFGGVVKREKVERGADWFVTDFQELLDVL